MRELERIPDTFLTVRVTKIEEIDCEDETAIAFPDPLVADAAFELALAARLGRANNLTFAATELWDDSCGIGREARRAANNAKLCDKVVSDSRR